MKPKGAEQDPVYQALVKDVEATQHAQGWLVAGGGEEWQHKLTELLVAYRSGGLLWIDWKLTAPYWDCNSWEGADSSLSKHARFVSLHLAAVVAPHWHMSLCRSWMNRHHKHVTMPHLHV